MNKKIILPIVLTLILASAVLALAVQNVSHYGMQITKGWNLVPRGYFFWGSSGDINQCSENFKYGYFYDPYKKEYFGGALQQMNANGDPSGSQANRIKEFADQSLNDRFSRIFDGKLPGLDVMWVYSSADCNLDTGRELVSYSTSQKQFPEFELQDIQNIQFFQGWNFFHIPDNWKDDDSIKDYLGSCDVTQVAVWDARSQQWNKELNNVTDVFNRAVISPAVRAASLPILLKVSSACNLSYNKINGGSASSPPGLPDNGNNSPTPTTTCTDSDGGANYYIKGTTRGLNAFGEGTKATDYCAWAPGTTTGPTNYVHEYTCQPSGSMADEDYLCPNGCQDGACIK